MSTYTSEPGTRLSGRYRLEDQVDAGGGWSLWKAIDEILARPVSVLTFAQDFPRVREAVTAARGASRLSDSRLAQVFDVDDSGERVYIVMEWVAGESLTDMLSDGPADPYRAAGLVAEAAQALAAAHRAGLAHLRLVPGSLRWTPGGGVKITGLGIVAALAGAGAGEDGLADPALTDTRDLARLLYAAVTGYWPGQEPTGLPPAPLADGAPCTPRQVAAGVPAGIDSVICQALFRRPGRDGSLITTPQELADALAQVAPPLPPAPPPYQSGNAGGLAPKTARQPAYAGQPPAREPAGWDVPPEWPEPAYRAGGHRRRRSGSVTARALVTMVVLLVLAAAGAAGWAFGHTPVQRSAKAGSSPSKSARPSSSTAASVVLKPVSATSADDPGSAAAAIDGHAGTAWHTEFYIGNPVFGGLKAGTGLVLDMGTHVRLSRVKVQFGPICCAGVRVEVGNTGNPASQDGFRTVAASSRAAGTVTFRASGKARGRYVLIWFTRLPPQAGSPNQFMAQVFNVVVRGSS